MVDTETLHTSEEYELKLARLYVVLNERRIIKVRLCGLEYKGILWIADSQQSTPKPLSFMHLNGEPLARQLEPQQCGPPSG